MNSIMYRDPNVKPWQSTKYIPPGFTSRYDTKRAAGDTGGLDAEKYAHSKKFTNGPVEPVDHRENTK